MSLDRWPLLRGAYRVRRATKRTIVPVMLMSAVLSLWFLPVVAFAQQGETGSLTVTLSPSKKIVFDVATAENTIGRFDREKIKNDVVIRVAESKHSSQCAARLKSFVYALDERLPVASSSSFLQELIERYFPLYGCDVDEAITISQQSRYFDRSVSYPKDVAIFFKRKAPNEWGFSVSFILNRANGNSRLPAAMVDKTR